MIRLLTIASIFAANIRLINSNEYSLSRTLTSSNRAHIGFLSTETQSVREPPFYAADIARKENENDKNNYVTAAIPEEIKFSPLKVITECDHKRTLNDCTMVKNSAKPHERQKEENGASGKKSGYKLVEPSLKIIKQDTTNKTIIGLKSNVYKRGPTQPTFLTTPNPLNDYKVSTTDIRNDTRPFEGRQAKSIEVIHENSLIQDNLYGETSTFNTVADKRNNIVTEIHQSTMETSKTPPKFKSKVAKSDKVLHTSSLEHQTLRPLPITPRGPEEFVKIKTHINGYYATRRPRLQDIFKITSSPSNNISRQITPNQTTFGKVRYSKPLEVSTNISSPSQPSNISRQIILPFPTNFLATSFEETVDFENTQSTLATTITILNRQKVRTNDSIEKIKKDGTAYETLQDPGPYLENILKMVKRARNVIKP